VPHMNLYMESNGGLTHFTHCQGGALYVSGSIATFSLTSTTIASNSVSGVKGVRLGGGVYVESGTMRLTSSSIVAWRAATPTARFNDVNVVRPPLTRRPSAIAPHNPGCTAHWTYGRALASHGSAWIATSGAKRVRRLCKPAEPRPLRHDDRPLIHSALQI
jgi:hypothetical protein